MIGFVTPRSLMSAALFLGSAGRPRSDGREFGPGYEVIMGQNGTGGVLSSVAWGLECGGVPENMLLFETMDVLS